jgi:hypothetical protein
MSGTTKLTAARVVLETRSQTLDTVEALVRNILNRAGCPACGLMSVLDIQFHGDPGPDMAKIGVTSAVYTHG